MSSRAVEGAGAAAVGGAILLTGCSSSPSVGRADNETREIERGREGEREMVIDKCASTYATSTKTEDNMVHIAKGLILHGFEYLRGQHF